MKPIPVSAPLPVTRAAAKQQPAVPVPGIDVLNSDSLAGSLLALAQKYSLESFTIATSDGLVFASSGGSTAQEDAASYSGHYNDIREAAGIALFGLTHKGSDLTGIIRSQGIITGETQKHIESDTKDILNKWI